MNFINYIKNWSSIYKNYKISKDLVCDKTKHHANKCVFCKTPITLHTICQDKYLSYLFVQKLGWSIPKQYYHGNIKGIPKNLPSNYVIKKPHGTVCNNVACIKDGCDLLTDKLIEELIETKFKNSFVIVEEFIENQDHNGKIPLDYKFIVFNGNIEFMCIVERIPNKKNNKTWYDKNFKKLGKLEKHQKFLIDSDKYLPNIDQINIAKDMFKHLKVYKNLFIRVDCYISNGKIIFGEFTPCPNGGMNYTKLYRNLLDKFLPVLNNHPN